MKSYRPFAGKTRMNTFTVKYVPFLEWSHQCNYYSACSFYLPQYPLWHHATNGIEKQDWAELFSSWLDLFAASDLTLSVKWKLFRIMTIELCMNLWVKIVALTHTPPLFFKNHFWIGRPHYNRWTGWNNSVQFAVSPVSRLLSKKDGGIVNEKAYLFQ